MEKIICYRCSKGIEIHPEGIVWAPLRLAIVDFVGAGKDFPHIHLMQWFHCPKCHHEYFVTTPIIDEGERIMP